MKAILESSRISLLVNGSPTDEFVPRKGLRQGDPLSPLLFNIMGEVLSRLLTRAKDKGVFEGIFLPNFQTSISHLQYADDVILFLKDDVCSVRGVKRVLQCFQLLSGLKINFHKSSVDGYGSVKEELPRWASILGCQVGNGQLNTWGHILEIHHRS